MENVSFIEITKAMSHARFKILSLDSYKGKTNTINHVVYFESTISLLDINDALKCRLFFYNILRVCALDSLLAHL